MPLVPKRELDQALRDLKEAEEEKEKAEIEQIRLQDFLEQTQEEIQYLKNDVRKLEAGTPELEFLLLLEREIRLAEHPMEHHRFDQNRLQWFLDQLVILRCTDAPSEKKSDPGDPEPEPEKKSDPPEKEKQVPLLKLCTGS